MSINNLSEYERMNIKVSKFSTPELWIVWRAATGPNAMPELGYNGLPFDDWLECLYSEISNRGGLFDIELIYELTREY